MTTSTSTLDQRFMAAAIRFARTHEGRTGTNPSVACLLVKDKVIVGRGVTGLGGRPHAEPIALEEAGNRAQGATAYVTLEPCAHHGRTPPCAQALIDAGIARVVSACTDPDDRVSGKGYAMLEAAGIQVEKGLLANEAARGLEAYLKKRNTNQPFVTLKLAITPDGKMGNRSGKQIAITGEVANRNSHLMRARHDAIMVGRGTIEADDPALTCRLEGMGERSPLRVLIDPALNLSLESALVKSARKLPTLVVSPMQPDLPRAVALRQLGVEIMACEMNENRVALPELLDDLGARGIASIMVEGGAALAESLLNEGLVDAVELYVGPENETLSGNQGHLVMSPITPAHMPQGFEKTRELKFQHGDAMDTLYRFERR